MLARAGCLVVANTGPAHLAAAVGTPVSACSPRPCRSGSGALPGARGRLGDAGAACRDTRATICPAPGHPCLSGVDPSAVVAAVGALRDRRRAQVGHDGGAGGGVNILLWHVHGSWTTAFVQGKHHYLVPGHTRTAARRAGPRRAPTWPDTVVEVDPEELAAADVDVVVLQRPEELDLAERGCAAGPAATCRRSSSSTTPRRATSVQPAPAGRPRRHAARPRHALQRAVLGHGAHPDHGHRARHRPPGAPWTGELTGSPSSSTSRSGAAGSPAPTCCRGSPPWPRSTCSAWGWPACPNTSACRPTGCPLRRPAAAPMHAELARRRVYLHLCRWTSLGLSLIEAMTIGMPVVALATTEAVAGGAPGAGVLSTRSTTCVDAAAVAARRARRGAPGRASGPARRPRRYGLDRFLADWDRLLEEEAMRIAMISEHASPLAVLGGVDAGGQNTHVAELAAALARAGHDVRVYTRRDDAGAARAVPAAGRVDRGARAGRARRAGRQGRAAAAHAGVRPGGWPAGGAAGAGARRRARALLDERAGRVTAAGAPGSRWCRPSTRSARSSAATRARRTPARPQRIGYERASAGPSTG